MYRNIKKKIFHIVAIIVIVCVIIFIAGMFILRYQVEGESNMPFEITKISIVESVEGTEIDSSEKWNFNVNENNDIYIYIEKNSGYGKTELIDTVKINNIVIEKKNDLGETKIYKPVADEKRMFNNLEENEITELLYNGDLQSDIKSLTISNQGGIVAFRYAINNLSKYSSEENEEIDHSKLLQLTNIKQEDLDTKLTFNIEIELKSGKKYQSTVEIEIPSNDIIEKGTTGFEKTDLDNIIFKRIEN
jgi:hypothetical protein